LQSPSAILYDRVTSNVAEADPEAAEPSLLDASSPAPSPQAGVALEARWPSTDPSERLPVYPKAPLKGAASGRSGRVARFAREALKTVATLLPHRRRASLRCLWDLASYPAPWDRTAFWRSAPPGVSAT